MVVGAFDMPTNLSDYLRTARIFNTHEHMWKEDVWRQKKPDILCELFENYLAAELAVAGLTPDKQKVLLDSSELDIEKRFVPAQRAWDACKLTGYGEATRLIASRFFEIEEINVKSLLRAQAKLPKEWPAGERLSILRDEGLYDHIQTDDFCWPCLPDKSGVDFFFYDLSWAVFCAGNLEQEKNAAGEWTRQAIHRETGVTVGNLATLREAMGKLFERYAPCAVAVKAQHAYSRTLLWRERSDAEAARALDAILRDPEAATVEERNCLGDWCWARGVELAIRHNLPFKIHTGYYAGHSTMPVEFIKAGNLCGLLRAYPAARFVLMHISWPYDDEIVALAKHYPNVWVDMCWAWSINPHASAQFVRGFIHAAPANKLFGFGGDTLRARTSVAYSMQARKWLGKALQAEIDEGDLTEAQAIGFAQRILQDNQKECFDLDGLRRRLAEKSSSATR
jgi:predicted TIM-barrel fold metal-dependent hydrolase